jgi:hypothetical protein
MPTLRLLAQDDRRYSRLGCGHRIFFNGLGHKSKTQIEQDNGNECVEGEN